MSKRVYTARKVTVAGVPVTVTVSGHELAVLVGRSGPQAAAGRLRVNRLSGTAAVAVYVAGEGGPGERWVAGLYPAAPGAAEQLLLCDGCFQAATGLLAECQDGCPHGDLDHAGLCLRDSPDECQWCGAPGRLHEVPRAEVQRRLPTVGEEDEGMWHLHYTDGAQGPFPSAQAAWDHWHAHGDGETPVPSEGKAGGGTVKTWFDEIGYPLYCDARPHEGDTRVDLTIRLYLSPQEYARYQGPESLRITLGEAGGAAEPSTGWPAGGDGQPARPAPAPAAPAEPASASTAKEHSDGRP